MAGIDRTVDSFAEAQDAVKKAQEELDRDMNPPPGPAFIPPSVGRQPFEYAYKRGPYGRPVPDVPGGK